MKELHEDHNKKGCGDEMVCAQSIRRVGVQVVRGISWEAFIDSDKEGAREERESESECERRWIERERETGLLLRNLIYYIYPLW